MVSRVGTIERRRNFLIELASYINSNGVDLKELITKHGIDANIKRALIDLDYVRELTHNSYVSNFKLSEIETVINRVRGYETELKKFYKEKKSQKQTSIEISSFLDKELIDELILRGYTGSLTPPKPEAILL